MMTQLTTRTRRHDHIKLKQLARKVNCHDFYEVYLEMMKQRCNIVAQIFYFINLDCFWLTEIILVYC